MSPALDRRRAGLLLHPSSLPGGRLDGDAERFIRFLSEAGFTVWQMLPLQPPHGDGSPYNALSAFAGHTGLLPDHGDGADTPGRAYQAFLGRTDYWLEDYCLFVALREELGRRAWTAWPPALRDREPAALAAARQRLAPRLEAERRRQFAFDRRWRQLRAAANAQGIRLFGDLPIFVAHDSADVWVHRDLFDLREDGQPRVVAGVPPDYFSATGQRWGNPLYRWDRLAETGYRWWLERVGAQLAWFDLLRIDHFRGLEACWAIPAEEATAVNGQWVPGPGGALFEALRARFGELPLVAEDLGLITEAVHRLREAYGIPGMKVLQFAFEGGPDNPYLPEHHGENCVVYTGTHDNDTTLGWFRGLPPDRRQAVLAVTGGRAEDMPWPLIETALASPCRLAILPMQDVLGLDSAHRMNRPGTEQCNWRWRFSWDWLADDLAGRLHALLARFDRQGGGRRRTPE